MLHFAYILHEPFMYILRPHLNSDVFLVACPLFFYTPLVRPCVFIPANADCACSIGVVMTSNKEQC